MPTATITGHAAISYARAARLPVCSYADPTAEARDDLTIAEAAAIAAEDPSLVYVEIERSKIVALRREAASADDTETVGICDRVLGGEDDARTISRLADVLVAALDADTDDAVGVDC